jgi:predicted O-methyltransferase YrrM
VDIDERMKAYLRDHLEAEDETLRAARARSEEADIPAIQREAGPALRWFARRQRAHHVIEIGAGGGYSGLWFLGGMDPRGILTTIDMDADNLGLAQRAFAEAGYGDRVRAMHGPALQVLPKLADAHYDIVFLDAAKSEYPEYLEHAKRLLRPSGLVLADNVLWSGRVADPKARDDDTAGLRAFNDAVLDDPELDGMLFPLGDGLLAAYYLPEDTESA